MQCIGWRGAPVLRCAGQFDDVRSVFSVDHKYVITQFVSNDELTPGPWPVSRFSVRLHHFPTMSVVTGIDNEAVNFRQLVHHAHGRNMFGIPVIVTACQSLVMTEESVGQLDWEEVDLQPLE